MKRPENRSKVLVVDRIRYVTPYCRAAHPTNRNGRMWWDIPLYYDDPMPGGGDTKFGESKQEVENVGGLSNSTFIIRKRNSANTTKIEDPTSPWPGIGDPVFPSSVFRWIN